MQEHLYAKGDNIYEMPFPDVVERPVCQGLRNPVLVKKHKAIVDKETDRTFAIVKDGYKLEPHQAVIEMHDQVVKETPGWGTPHREVWLNNYGGRMKLRYTFKEMPFEIAPGDEVSPTLVSYASYDTSVAQRTLVGGWRWICSNGAVLGKILEEYKHKHTASLDLDAIKRVMSGAMANYEMATAHWKQLAERTAFLNEVNAFELLGFNKNEKISIEKQIKSIGNVKRWEEVEKEEREVEINAWALYNIYTEEATHRVLDVSRRAKITDSIASTFAN